jgi:hypothetical protein
LASWANDVSTERPVETYYPAHGTISWILWIHDGSNSRAQSRGDIRKFDRGAGEHMKISLLLADAAQADAQSGKVNALGLGRRQCQTRTPAFALVLFLDIDWDETNKKHRLLLPQVVSASGPDLR